jgi:ferredoxin--NADP+ reductase
MSLYSQETVLSVHHWNDSLFSFQTTRDRGLRFQAGQFVMIGLDVDGRPLVRAYSVASAPYDDHLEFYSIKVPDGPLTSRLQHLRAGDSILVGRKPTGSLIRSNLKPGRNLYLLGTGTGLAPFLSVIHEPAFYAAYHRIVLTHGVRLRSELAYHGHIREVLPEHEYVGALVKEQLLYYPTVTREQFGTRGRLTELIESGKLFHDLGLPPLEPSLDRVMICGSPSMLAELTHMLVQRGFSEGTNHGPGEFVIERAFVET